MLGQKNTLEKFSRWQRGCRRLVRSLSPVELKISTRFTQTELLSLQKKAFNYSDKNQSTGIKNVPL
jgi:hypothetical protein